MPRQATNYQERQAAKHAQQQNAAAGLELRERQLEQNTAADQQRIQQSAQGNALAAAKFARDQAVENYDMTLAAKQLNDSASFVNALGSLSEEDPDFDFMSSALLSKFKYALNDGAAKSAFETKQKAHIEVKQRVQKIAADTGVDPWAYVERDENKRFVKLNWAKVGNARAELIAGNVDALSKDPRVTGVSMTPGPDGKVTATMVTPTGVAKDLKVVVPPKATEGNNPLVTIAAGAVAQDAKDAAKAATRAARDNRMLIYKELDTIEKDYSNEANARRSDLMLRLKSFDTDLDAATPSVPAAASTPENERLKALLDIAKKPK